MYKGKKTLFYNGEILWEGDLDGDPLIYNEEERQTWEVVIILPGVEVIPDYIFNNCDKIEAVIMSDTVKRIGHFVFDWCTSLVYVKLSTNLESIDSFAFHECSSLTSIFIPPSCVDIDEGAFSDCHKLINLVVPRHTQLFGRVIERTALIKASPIADDDGDYDNNEEANEWIKTHHTDNEFSLHRACASYNPIDEVIFDIVKRQGVKAFKKQDSVGVTPSRYLCENPYTEIKEQKIIKRYILDMMGETV
ncbi:hypothetical protein CTEN210_01105 [Chaetoceros tenuissimus]|uniref:Leucine-rich repeat domain-containing protein n=1 Tax=Chaetoceros tenuissimus TaxID=426638 RepID=A0AAD3CGY4_9STRA|nr:hypothetical protein CTEN210_01105 [Chaetoceros tenuissimus]